MITIAPHADIVSATVGGLLIGASSSLFLAILGRISGMSGLVASALKGRNDNDSWSGFADSSTTSLSFIFGLLGAGYIMKDQRPEVFGDIGSKHPFHVNIYGLTVAAFLVAFGVRMGNGCTSGHGVCGLARRSMRSFTAVMTFMGTGVLSAYVMRVYGKEQGVWPLSALLTSNPEETEALLASHLVDSQTGRPRSVLAIALAAFLGHLLMRYASGTRGAGTGGTSSGAAPKSLQDLAQQKVDNLADLPLSMAANTAAFLCGTLFGVGLCLSGMTDRARIYNFLDAFNTTVGFDYSLMGVMGGAVMLNLITFEVMNRVKLMPALLKLKLGKMPANKMAKIGAHTKRIDSLMDPTAPVDQALFTGAALFGLGWGLGGMCPGPALVGMVSPTSHAAVYFCCCLFVFIGLHAVYDIYRSKWVSRNISSVDKENQKKFTEANERMSQMAEAQKRRDSKKMVKSNVNSFAALHADSDKED